MARNIYFLVAVLIVFGIASAALSMRSCSEKRVPGFMNPRLTLEEALAASEQSGKPVFAVVAADDDPHCLALKREGLSDGRVIAWIKANTEPVYVDCTKFKKDPRVMELLARLEVETIPAMIVMRRNGQIGHL